MDSFAIGFLFGCILVFAYKTAARIYSRYVWAKSYKEGWRFAILCWLKYDTFLAPFLIELDVKTKKEMQ